MNQEIKKQIMQELNHIINETLYTETSQLPDEIVLVPSSLTAVATPVGKRKEMDGTIRRDVKVDTVFRFAENTDKTGLTSDQALLMAHRLLAAAYAALRQYA